MHITVTKVLFDQKHFVRKQLEIIQRRLLRITQNEGWEIQ